MHKDLHTKGGGTKKDTNVVAPANAVSQKGGGKKGNNNTRKRGRSKGGGGPSDNDAVVQLKEIQRVVSTSSDSDLSAVGGGARDGLGGQMMMQATTGGSRDKLASDCLQYFTQIQQELLSSKPHLFNALVNATGEFASGEVDHVEFVGHMISLLDGHTNLIMGLNRVLPEQFKIEAADLQASFFPAQEGREEHKPKRRRTKTPKVKVETDNTQGVVSTTLASAAKSGCRKCTEELATGVKTRREHDDGCPRKQRRRSSSSSSGRSSKSSSSRSA